MRCAAILLAAGSLALTGCSDEGAEVTDEDIAGIEASLANGSELSWELTQAETRVAAMCMEDLGFDVHDENALHGGVTPGRFEGFASPYARIPTVEQAEEFAFGQWISFGDSPDAEAVREDPDYLAFTAAEDGWWDPAWDAAHEEWQATDEEYRQAWEEAFLGPERVAYEAAMSEALQAGEDPAEIDLGRQPPFGGCELETIEIVYGGPERWEADDGDYWSRPDTENPLASLGDAGYGEFSARYVEQEQAFLDCLDERGYGRWEFDEVGRLPTVDYLSRAYPEAIELFGMPDDESVPELTDEAEDLLQAEGPEAFEFAMALDFAECAEDSGLRDGTEAAWARMKVEQLIDRETEVYAWEQEIEGYLANAQDHLAGG
ncbi:hypothetical protein LO763_22970 [Glycomyces sp. A-F 0318]|uniref:hypothetical protein n=1 Tax=Glycomyces amatae TaxID=2881355 RepID=UPI001E33AD93|nr:hypothetical protein [Glycomyces amatae]MCD0446483.1 hypothetical protein [Glycomyces amatae]